LHGIVIAATTHVMAFIVIGDRVIALVHLPTAEPHEN
jgi:hypothetical protein